MQNILSGMRLVEGTAFIAAPSGGMTLAQLGADVIRFDPIGGGIDYDRWPVTKDGASLYWHSLNKGKRSIAVNFRSPEGRELLSELIAAPGENAGIFLTNFPGKGWLSYDKLRKRRDDLIYLNLIGDRHESSAVDYTVNCKVGLPHLNTPTSSDAPLNSPFPAWDVIAGQHIAIGLLAAERHRNKTSQGQQIKLTLADVALATMGHLGYIGEVMVNDDERPSIGNHIYGSFGSDFVCQDGRRLMVVGISQKQWQALVNVTGTSGVLARLSTSMQLDFTLSGDRYAARERIATLMAEWFMERDFETVATALDNAGACWGKYQTTKELVQEDVDCSPDNPLFEMVEQPGVGQYLMPQNPLTFSGAERHAVKAAPKLGQHTEEILTELGLSSMQIARLYDSGVVAGSS